jgi:hypothetical protein
MMFRRKKPPVNRDLQAAADAAAWRLLLRRRPEIAERIRLAISAGKPLQGVVDEAAQPATVGLLKDPCWPRLRLLLPCAVHGCARSLGLLVPARHRI